MNDLLFTLASTFGALAAGYAVQTAAVRSSRPEWHPVPDRLSAWMKHSLVLYVTPWVLLLSFWTLELQLWMLTMPLLGVIAHLLGGGLGLAASRYLLMAPAQAGSMFAVSALSNLHSLGGLSSYVFFGEQGYALGAVYRLFEPLLMFGAAFPISAAIGGRYTSAGSRLGWIRRVFTDPYVLLPNGGLLAGLALNLSPWSRPAALETVSPWLIVGSSLLMVFAIGLSFRPARVTAYIRPSLLVAAIKFAATPALMGGLAWLLGYARLEGGLAIRVVILMASMPVAFNALVPPTLFDLDLDLANSSWLITTGALAVVLPILHLLLAG